MKYFIVIYITTILAQYVSAQQIFAPIGAKWHYSSPCSGNSPDCGYYLFEVIKDTMLLGKSATVLNYSINGQLVEEAKQILYSDNGRVYYWMNDDFQLLYDYNAHAGDTLTLKMGPSYFTGGDTFGFYKIVIDSVIYTNVSGLNLKKFFNHSLYDITFEGAAWRYFGPVMERVGDLGFLFGHSVFFPTIDHFGWIRCYEDNDVYYNPNSVQCDFILGIWENTQIEKVYVYPNPTRSVLHLQSEEEVEFKNKSYKIYDMFGNRHAFGILQQTSLDVSYLPDGLYVLEIIGNHFKFLKK